jgi:hypothetical protein
MDHLHDKQWGGTRQAVRSLERERLLRASLRPEGRLRIRSDARRSRNDEFMRLNPIGR